MDLAADLAYVRELSGGLLSSWLYKPFASCILLESFGNQVYLRCLAFDVYGDPVELGLLEPVLVHVD